MYLLQVTSLLLTLLNSLIWFINQKSWWLFLVIFIMIDLDQGMVVIRELWRHRVRFKIILTESKDWGLLEVRVASDLWIMSNMPPYCLTVCSTCKSSKLKECVMSQKCVSMNSYGLRALGDLSKRNCLDESNFTYYFSEAKIFFLGLSEELPP